MLGTIAALIGGFAFKSHEYTSSGTLTKIKQK